MLASHKHVVHNGVDTVFHKVYLGLNLVVYVQGASNPDRREVGVVRSGFVAELYPTIFVDQRLRLVEQRFGILIHFSSLQ